MEKRRRSQDGLPEAMIQQIQSFMSGKEAARTTILSKSWYNAWLTRPNLVFDHREFSNCGNLTLSKEFSNFSKKTLQRYQDLNIKIDSFKCRMVCNDSLANELTVEAIKMGATDISFDMYRFVLPVEVLESESLVRLSVTDCKMEGVKVNCSKLKYLYLCGVFLVGDSFWDIISSCPLIECLELRQCKGGLKRREILFNLSKNMGLFELHNLKKLLLEGVKICSLFFSDFSSKFPCLKNLSVHKCPGYNKLQIYSRSLEFISLENSRSILIEADFDVPNITRLSVTGCKMEDVKVNYSTLKYLSLCQVFLEGYLFWNIISSCPLIERLELRECKCGLKNRKKLMNLSKGFELHKLKTLLLEKVKICNLFFSDFSSRFPFLKDLSVHKCSGYNKLQIYSGSLEFISLVDSNIILKADFDVPNLRKFCYSGESSFPSMSFPNSCNWESHVSMSNCRDLSTTWFLNLNTLLRNLSLSKVSLNLQSSYWRNINETEKNTLCLPRPLVENLTIYVPSPNCATLLDNLVQWCRPVFVTQNNKYSILDGNLGIESLKVVYRIFMQQRNSMDDFENFSVEFFDEAVFRWRTIPWSLVDSTTSRVAQRRVRFHLRWRQQ